MIWSRRHDSVAKSTCCSSKGSKSSIPRTHVSWLTVSVNPAPEESDASKDTHAPT